jgi:hypothetical protein
MARGPAHTDHGRVTTSLTGTGEHRVIRPAAVVPQRAARDMLRWLELHDVTCGGVWAHDVSWVQRFSGPFDGIGGMRGSAVLLGSVHMVWDRYEATIFRANVTPEGVQRGLTVERLCDDLLACVGLTLASCPRAALVDAPAPDPFRRAVPLPRAGA